MSAVVLVDMGVHASQLDLLDTEVLLTYLHKEEYDDETDQRRYRRYQCEIHRRVEHHYERTGDGDHRGDQMRHALTAAPADCIRVVGDTAHYVSAGAPVVVRDVDGVQLDGEILAHLPRDIF